MGMAVRGSPTEAWSERGLCQTDKQAVANCENQQRHGYWPATLFLLATSGSVQMHALVSHTAVMTTYLSGGIMHLCMLIMQGCDSDQGVWPYMISYVRVIEIFSLVVLLYRSFMSNAPAAGTQPLRLVKLHTLEAVNH